MATNGIVTPRTRNVFRRKKAIKSCEFCRRRKLKCDHQRPICSSCKAKNSKQCVYLDNEGISKTTVNHSRVDHAEAGQILNNYQSQELLASRVDELQKQIAMLNDKFGENSYSNSPTGSSIPSHGSDMEYRGSPITSISNPLSNYNFLHVKDSGRRIMYGATSIRTHLSKDKLGFGEKCFQLSSKVKLERNKWKERNKDKSSLREMEIVEDAYDLHYTNLIDEVCGCLPSHGECLSLLNRFFDARNDELYQMNRIVDKNKVMNDYFNSFVQNSEVATTTGQRSIVSLDSGAKKNFYKVGVIIMILCLVRYGPAIPNPIRRFITMITGQITAKTYFIERVQFLALRCEYRRYHMTEGDDTNLLNLIGLAAESAVAMGLNKGIRDLYRGQENVVGTIESLENLWYGILLLDVECSFQVGKCPCATNTDINVDMAGELPNSSRHSIYKGKLKKFLQLTRPMLFCIDDPRGVADLKGYCSELLSFVAGELPSVSEFTDAAGIERVDLRYVRLFNVCLQMVIVFNSLQFSVFNDCNMAMRDTNIQGCLVLLKVNCILLERCFQLDKKFSLGAHSSREVTCVTPYLNLFLYLTVGLIPRVTTLFGSMIYYKLTVFEQGFIMPTGDSGVGAVDDGEWDFSHVDCSVAVRDGQVISLLRAYRVYCGLISRWANPPDELLREILAKSSHVNVASSVERINRTVITKMLECRARAEDRWRQREGNEADRFKSGGTSGDDNNNKNDDAKEVAESVLNDFWMQFSVGWEDLMSEAYTDNFLNSL